MGSTCMAYDDKIKKVKDKKQEEILLINEEADDEIRIINEKIQIVIEKRDRRAKSCRVEAKKSYVSFNIPRQIRIRTELTQ